MAQVGQKSETWKQKRANMRASVSMRVRVRACACASGRARARARSLMATLPGGGPAEDGSELRSHACGVAKVEARGHAPGVGRIVIVTVSTPPRGTPVTAGGEGTGERDGAAPGGIWTEHSDC